MEIGSGHVIRCLTLAAELRRGGATVEFVCRSQPGDLCDHIERSGFPVYRLPPARPPASGEAAANAAWLGAAWHEDAAQTATALRKPAADWVVADHYAIEWQWEGACRRWARRIMVIDDLADRRHDCELLADPNYYADMTARYRELVPATCTTLLGPRHALLRPEFAHARRTLRPRRNAVSNILVFFAGADLGNQTAVALEALRLLARPDIRNEIVVGSSNPHRQKIADLCAQLPNTAFHCQISNMAELMANADLAIGGVGGTAWERLALGLPSITVAIAQNQRRIAEDLHAVGALIFLGDAGEVSAAKLCAALAEVTAPGSKVPRVPDWIRELIDGGGAARVAAAMSQVESPAV